MHIPNDNYVGLDFETYATTDLLKHGLERYVKCPDFQPLLAVVVRPEWTLVLDFSEPLMYRTNRRKLMEALHGQHIVAHNAGFEQAVLRAMDIHIPSERFIDSAVLARQAGAAGKLEVAAPQLLDLDKMEAGTRLIKLFSIPGKYQEANFHGEFDPQIVKDHPEDWAEFIHYCKVDAMLSRQLAEALLPQISARELQYQAVTMDMNNAGWPVDVPLVERMQFLYEQNTARELAKFREDCDAADLNLNSHPQLKEWCKVRGVQAKSFDEKAVESLIKTLTRRIQHPATSIERLKNYREVLHLLETKQMLGGSSLKKLRTILDTVGPDGRLHDQYLHIGAGATFRTTGRGVQMQNLKRLNGKGDNMQELWEPGNLWSNSRMADNLRQVFTSSQLNGQLIVGDFSSVESRGLAWQAGETWKLDAYRNGVGVYEEQAAKFYHIPRDAVTKEQRTFGKVGELSCGYGAGPDAVQSFAAKMGVEMSDIEAGLLVKDWRTINAATVDYWKRLDEALHHAVDGFASSVDLPQGDVVIKPIQAPLSLTRQTGVGVSLQIEMWLSGISWPVLIRVIHGVYNAGRNIQYWKPTERKTGALWVDRYVDPKTKKARMYSVYGGKLAGLLTQSLCREVFFSSLHEFHSWAKEQHNVQVIGQFHDEIVVDWVPSATGPSLDMTKEILHACMTSTHLIGFPLEAEIKNDYRYIK